MHPAFSIIVFTVLSGAGLGLLSLASIAESFEAALRMSAAERACAAEIGLVLTALGLLASTLHLAKPRNAWRAFLRVRTSWLSREAVLSLLLYPFATIWLAQLYWQDGTGLAVDVVAVFILVLAIGAVFSTGMIYASLRTIPQWHDPLVPVNYLLLAFASGALLLTSLLALLRGAVEPRVVLLTLALLSIAAVGKSAYYFRIGKLQRYSINSAIAVTQGEARLLESGQSSRAFLDREFRKKTNARLLKGLRLVVAILAYLLPVVLIAGLPGAAASTSTSLALLATAAAFLGLGVERWLFFAEARHVVNLYYGDTRN